MVSLEQLLELAQEEKDDLEEQLQDLAQKRDEELNELKEQLRLARARQAQASWRLKPPSPSKVELERQNAVYERANRQLGENMAKLLREKKVAEDQAEQANSSATEWSRRWGELDQQLTVAVDKQDQSEGILARAQQEAVKLQSELFVDELLQHQAYVMGDETLDETLYDQLDHRLEDALAERDAVWEPIFECAVEEASTAKAELHDAFVVAGRLHMQVEEHAEAAAASREAAAAAAEAVAEAQAATVFMQLKAESEKARAAAAEARETQISTMLTTAQAAATVAERRRVEMHERLVKHGEGAVRRQELEHELRTPEHC